MTMLQGNVKQLETNLNEKEMEIASKTKENDITKYKLAQLELENEQNIIKTSLLKKQIVDLKDEKQSNSLSKSPKPTKKPTKKE